ncbi:RING-H2 finger protein ATL32-like [Lotus japonicus]|uniref:RING-H2 finger protein ATL32-like n=1 Tax=Lotus japonicus TaxID=34305 RepID=UPI002582AB9B|nr:RING-H2 finger protein ATL32-like [Lotus japonicus]
MNFKVAKIMLGPYTPFIIFSAVLIGAILALAAYRLIHLIYYIMSQRGQHRNNNIRHVKVKSGGVPVEILNKIPILKFSSTQNSEEEIFLLDHSECYICLGEWEDGEQVRLFPSCNHAFHASCIEAWFKIHANCPVCRSPIMCERLTGHASEQRVCSHVPETPSNHHNDNQVLPAHHHQSMNNDVAGSMSRFQRPCPPLLLHSVSFSTSNMPKKPRVVGRWLKRSLSENQSSIYVGITTIQRGCETASTTTTSSTIEVVMKSRPIRHLDRMSSLLMRSFSQFRNIGSVRSNQILPN